MATRKAHWDFETYSTAPLKTVGAYRYAQDPTTEVLILCWCVETDDKRSKVRTWVPQPMSNEAKAEICSYLPEDMLQPIFDSKAVPAELLELVEDDTVQIFAHNASFESVIWQYVVAPKFGAPRIRPHRWRCSAAMAAAAGLPRALDRVGAALQVPIQKDKDGTRLIGIFCKPRKPTKLNKATRTYPADRSEEFARFISYCRTDVLAEMDVLEIVPSLSASEWRVFGYDALMNDRGLPLDMYAVECAYEMLQVLERRVQSRVRELTGGINPTQRDKMLVFLNELLAGSELEELENLQAKTIRDLLVLKGKELPETAIELLQLRIEGGKASTKKLKKMLQVACEDGRVRGAFLYMGAHTGRLSGRLVQFQNFIRGEYSAKHMEMLFHLILDRDIDTLCWLFEWPIDALAQALRGFIRAGDGKKFVVCDFSAIEARILVWLAQETETLKLYFQNADLYKRLAVKLYKLSHEGQVTTPQRKFAKDLTLGCFGKDTVVLTSSGNKRIVDVLPWDKVWDGIEWVNTLGPIYMGKKEVIKLCGTVVTPDHLVLCGQQWHRAVEVMQHTELYSSALNAVTSRSLHIGLALRGDYENTNASVTAGEQRTPERIPLKEEVQMRVTIALRENLPLPLLKTAQVGNILNQRFTKSTVLISSREDIERPENNPGPMSGNACIVQKNTRIKVGFLIQQEQLNASSAGKNGVALQRRTKNTGTSIYDLETCISGVSRGTTQVTKASRFAKGGKTLENLPKIVKSYRGINRDQMNLSSIGETTTATTHQQTVDSLRQEKTCTTADVYDLVECGPRSRFTVITDAGPMVVHNCGFQLGGVGFQLNCFKRGIVIELDEAKHGVQVYREANPNVVRFWYDVERAAIRAVEISAAVTNPVNLRNLAFFVDSIWFCIRLPSGRLLRYPYPRVEKVLRFNRPTKKLTFRTEVKGKWIREGTYGGKLVENIVQAVARDIMVEAWIRAEKRGYAVVGTVHDELITEVDVDFGSKAELEDILRVVPVWAKGAPINAEGWEGKRYRK